MIIYNKYINNEDITWYDSTNVIFSKCYDNNKENKTLKIVFSNGRTYLYKDVNVRDYVVFKNSHSNGRAVNDYIVKKYKGVRISDTDLNQLNEYKNSLMTEENNLNEEKFSNIIYHIDICNETNEFILKLNDKPIFNGIEGNISVIDLLKSMNINFTRKSVDIIEKTTDENKNELILN